MNAKVDLNYGSTRNRRSKRICRYGNTLDDEYMDEAFLWVYGESTGIRISRDEVDPLGSTLFGACGSELSIVRADFEARKPERV